MSTSSQHHLVRFSILATLGVSMLIGGVANAESADSSLGDRIEVQRLAVEPAAQREDAHGLNIGLRYRVGAVEVEKALYVVARITMANGSKVTALAKSAAFRDRNDNSLHGKKQITPVPRGTWRETEIFIPYYAMKLAPGDHQLTVRLEAVSDPGQCKFGERPRLVPVIGKNQSSFTLTKPPYKMVQLLIRSANVIEEASDVSLWPWRARPDLKWRLRFRAGAGGIMHSSKVRDDVYSAGWKEYSPEFPFSQGDLLSLSVLDQDVMSHDELGTVKLSLQELLDLRQNPRPLKAGKVSSLVLGPIKAR
jgi:hypothetical protein